MNSPSNAMKRFVTSQCWLALVFCLVGCDSLDTTSSSTPAPGAGSAAGNPNPVSPDQLRAGDKITIGFSDMPNPPGAMDLRIRDDGMIGLPLGVQVKAAGKRASDLELEIQREYVPKYYRRLTVNVKPEQRVFYVDGYVRGPNRYEYVGEMTVLRAVSVAGGFNEYARKDKVELTRADGSKTVVNCVKARKNTKLDLIVYPGDRIYVPQRIL